MPQELCDFKVVSQADVILVLELSVVLQEVLILHLLFCQSNLLPLCTAAGCSKSFYPGD